MKSNKTQLVNFTCSTLTALGLLAFASIVAAKPLSGGIHTTDMTGTIVNENVNYGLVTDVYLSGGPQNLNASGLPDGTYYFQVTDPSGKTLLSTDNAVCRQLTVAGGNVTGAAGPCPHVVGAPNPANGTTPVQLAPFSTTPNAGGEYKAWLIAQGGTTAISGSDPKVIDFAKKNSKTDNYKILAGEVPQGSCQPSSSLSAQVIGTDVTSYVPKGNWFGPPTGVSAVNIEGASITPTLMPTPGAVNSCASNPVTGVTVCSENGTAVHLITVAAGIPSVSSTLASSGVGTVFFSGGACTNCGVAMDAVNNKALVSMAVAPGIGGFQFLDLSTSLFEPSFASMAPLGGLANISENPLIDPIRNLLLSATENNDYEIIDVTATLAPLFFENPIPVLSGGLLDSSGEDCSTGIVLAPAEFSGPSEVYIADISNPVFAPFVAGLPGTWTAPQQVQSLSESFLSAGASGIAVAQGTHTGIVTGEFGGDAITAISLPTTSGSGAVPAIVDWVTCRIPGGWSHGLDPHTVTAYQSPNSGNAVGLLADFPVTSVAVVDLTDMLDITMLPRTVGGHGCAGTFLPASIVSFVPVP